MKVRKLIISGLIASLLMACPWKFDTGLCFISIDSVSPDAYAITKQWADEGKDNHSPEEVYDLCKKYKVSGDKYALSGYFNESEVKLVVSNLEKNWPDNNPNVGIGFVVGGPPDPRYTRFTIFRLPPNNDQDKVYLYMKRRSESDNFEPTLCVYSVDIIDGSTGNKRRDVFLFTPNYLLILTRTKFVHFI